MGCLLCSRRQADPQRGPSPWRRGVVVSPSGQAQQVLVCPGCQEVPGWEDVLARCSACGSVALMVRLGEVSCRQCGRTVPAPGTRAVPDPDAAAREQLGAEVAAAVDRVLGRSPSGP